MIETFGSGLSPVWGLALVLLFGDGIARLLRRAGVVRWSGRVESAGMRILLGLAMIPFLCLAMDLTTLPINRVSLSVAMVAVFLTGMIVSRRGLAHGVVEPRGSKPPEAGSRAGAGNSVPIDAKRLLRSPAALLLILALVTVVFASVVQTSLYPPRSYDALVGWDVVGKVMAYEGKVRSSVFTNIDFNAQCAYAPFCATNQGYWYLFFPYASRFWVPLITAGFCLVLWSRVCRWTGSSTAAGLSTLLVFLPPTLTYHLTVGQTDLPAMVYTTLAFFSAAELLRGHGRVAPIAFWALIATAVRSEGALFALALTIVGLLLARKGRWRWVWITATSAVFFAFWNLFVMRFLIGYDPGEYFRRTIDFDPARMAEVIQRAVTIVGTPSFYGEFSGLVVLVPIVWALGKWGTRRGWFAEDEASRVTTFLIPILIVSFFCYLPFFYQWNPDLNPLWTMEHTFKRGMFRFIPSLIVVIIASPPVLALLRRCEPPGEGWSARSVYAAAILLLAASGPVSAQSPASDLDPPPHVDDAMIANYQRIALLDLDFMLGTVFQPPATSPWRTLAPGEVRRLELPRAPAERDSVGGAHQPLHMVVWVWRDGSDLVAAVDENGDAGFVDSRPDSVEDCFVIDYESDGTVDRVVDWMDLDADGRADRLVLYTLPVDASPRSATTCFVIDQFDEERGFWQFDRWEYRQATVQFLCDFSGDQFFTWGYYRPSEARWVSRIENPFCFYDADGDGLTEMALQFSGEDTELASLRWSIDSDNDADEMHPYDYDFSLNLLGQVRVPPTELDTLELRGGGEIALLAWNRAGSWSISAPWRQALLAVDENDRNVDPNDPEERERWEGVIASPPPGFPELGGPACGTLNKRYEICRSLKGRPTALYLSEIDGRMHLVGGSLGWIDIDEDSDGVRDARLQLEDRDEDGYFDTWLWDGDGDGEFESTEEFLDIDESSTRPISLDFESIREAEQSIEGLHGGLSQTDRYRADIARWRKTGKFTPLLR